jgi:uncharacterized protein
MFTPPITAMQATSLSYYTSVYAALLACGYVWLSLRTVVLRRKLRVGLGDGGHEALQRAMRAHANFAEYVPLCLLCMYFCELSGAPAWMLHALGTTLVLARLLHARGISSPQMKGPFRPVGMALTLTVMLCATTYLLMNAMR